MYPFSYTGLKVIHDQKIQEAMEHQRLDAGRETQKPGLLQMLSSVLAPFDNHEVAHKEACECHFDEKDEADDRCVASHPASRQEYTGRPTFSVR